MSNGGRNIEAVEADNAALRAQISALETKIHELRRMASGHADSERLRSIEEAQDGYASKVIAARDAWSRRAIAAEERATDLQAKLDGERLSVAENAKAAADIMTMDHIMGVMQAIGVDDTSKTPTEWVDVLLMLRETAQAVNADLAEARQRKNSAVLEMARQRDQARGECRRLGHSLEQSKEANRRLKAAGAEPYKREVSRLRGRLNAYAPLVVAARELKATHGQGMEAMLHAAYEVVDAFDKAVMVMIIREQVRA